MNRFGLSYLSFHPMYILLVWMCADDMQPLGTPQIIT